MGVDLRCAHVLMPEQLVHSADIVASLQQVTSEGVPESVPRCPLTDSDATNDVLDGGLGNRFVEVMAPSPAGDAIHVEARGRKYPLPRPLPAGVWVLARQRPG